VGSPTGCLDGGKRRRTRQGHETTPLTEGNQIRACGPEPSPNRWSRWRSRS
jgi:hypothetical protein